MEARTAKVDLVFFLSELFGFAFSLIRRRLESFQKFEQLQTCFKNSQDENKNISAAFDKIFLNGFPLIVPYNLMLFWFF